MRKVSWLSVVLVSLLSACSLFGGEKVHRSYVGPASMDQDQISRLLYEHGYTDITGLHKNGNDWVGSATNRDGQTVNFDIDKSGSIHTK